MRRAGLISALSVLQGIRQVLPHYNTHNNSNETQNRLQLHFSCRLLKNCLCFKGHCNIEMNANNVMLNLFDMDVNTGFSNPPTVICLHLSQVL